MILEDLGWTEARAADFISRAAEGLIPGRVILEHNHVYRIATEEGERLAETAGRLKHRAEGRQALPVIGDWVALRPDQAGTRHLIREVLPRRSSFSRKAAGRETEEQVIAANIDTVFVVFGLDAGVNRRAIERYLVVARRSGAAPVVVLNKSDMTDAVDAARAEAETVAGETPVVVVSSLTGAGVDELERLLSRGRTAALLGPSGAGKSSLVNRLVGSDVLATGEVRAWDLRGRHTSVHRQLVLRERGGLLIDTPGMRELQLWDGEGVGDTFTDVQEFATSCRFRDCRHDREPGCAVKAAVESTALDASRYASFLKLQAEQAAIERKREERMLAQDKKAGKRPQGGSDAVARRPRKS